MNGKMNDPGCCGKRTGGPARQGPPGTRCRIRRTLPAACSAAARARLPRSVCGLRKAPPPSVLMLCLLLRFPPTSQTVQLGLLFSCRSLPVGVYNSLFVTLHTLCALAASGPCSCSEESPESFPPSINRSLWGTLHVPVYSRC